MTHPLTWMDESMSDQCSKLPVCASCPLRFIIKRKRPKLSEGQKLKTESHGNVLRPLVSQLPNSTSSQSAILYFTSPSVDERELSAFRKPGRSSITDNSTWQYLSKVFLFFFNDSVTHYSMPFILSDEAIFKVNKERAWLQTAHIMSKICQMYKIGRFLG